MSKISTYEVAPVPKLADKLIGTSVGGEIENITYNFTLQELLELFLPIIPANNLQGVLDYGNTATQDINLFGTITTTNLDVTDTANLFITYLNEETHIVGSVFDSVDSVGTAGQVLTSTGDGVEWFTLPPIFTPNLQQVLEVGNTANIDILLDANIEALDVSADTATVGVNLTIGGTITDNNSAVGSSGQVLSSTVTGVSWISLPVYSATSPLLFNPATGVFSIQVANGTQGGYLTANDWITFNGKQDAGNYITALTGEATASGPGSAAVTLSNAAVTGKVLTGLNVTGGNVVATDSILTAFGKVQNQINGLVGGVQYQGVWNANTNTPTLTSSVGTQGHYYIVNVAGTTNLNGITDWQVGDWAIFSGGAWQKVDNTDSVTSVNGFTGAVSLTTDNIPEGTTNLYYLDSRARAALSFAAGSGAYNNTTGVITIPTDNNQILNGAGYITLSSISATSPLAYNNLTGVFSIQQADATHNGYLSSTDWSTFNGKQNYLGGTGLVKSTAGTITYITDNSGNWNTAYNRSIISAAVTGTTTKTLTLNEQDGNTITASWTDLDTGLTSVGVSMPSAFSVANSPLTANGTIAVTGAGTTLQYIDGTGALRTFPGLTGYVPYTGATTNVDLGEFGISAGYFQADLTPTGALQVGRMQWNSTDGTMDLRLLGNNVTLQIGQENVTRVVNKSGIDLLEANYQVVRVRKVAEGGAQGQRLAVVLAQGNNENNSTEVLGLVTETINVNQEGFITAFGEVKEINTTGSLQGETWVDGDILYVSTSVAGQLTNIRPVAPNHAVTVGYVTYAHANHGKIYMAIDTGYELGELHNVYAPSPAANASIWWNTSTLRYENNTIAGILGYTPANPALYVPYTGATGAVNLGSNAFTTLSSITGGGLKTTNGVQIKYGDVGFGSDPDYLTIESYKASTVTSLRLADGDTLKSAILIFNNSADYNYTFPNASGTLALTSDLTGGTVTSVAALTLGTSGTDLSSTVANPTTTPVITLNVPTASAANRGALSAADWSTFNTKVGGVTATSPLFSSGGQTPNITIQQSSGSQAGFLSAADWTTFNSKQAAGNYITSLTGEATGTGPGATTVTLNNASVTAKVLTGINITGGTVQATDTMLTAFGKLQNQINGLVGGSIYQGTWNASTNTPALASGVGTKGYYYIVSVAGTTNLDGITDWFVGDWAIFDGTAWQQVDNTDAVVSVNGQTGAVSLTTDNIPEGATNQYFLNSRARAALSFTAGSGAYNSTTGVITIPTNNNQITNGANYITLASLSGTAPIVYSNTTGVISITQAGTASNGYLSSTDWNTFNNKQPAGNYVPYTGATGAVDLGVYGLTAISLYLKKNGTNGSNIIWDTTSGQSIASTGQTSIGPVGTDGFGVYFEGATKAFYFSATNITAQRIYTMPNASGTIALVGGSGVGTVTSVAALTIGTTGTDLSSTVANSTTTPVITLNVPTASATNRGALSAADWTTFNNKQSALTNPVTGTGTTNFLPKFTGASAIGDSIASNVGTSSEIFRIAQNGNFGTRIEINNATDGTAAQSYIGLSGTTGAKFLNMGKVSASFTPLTWLDGGDGYLYNGTANLSIYNESGNIKFRSNGVTSTYFMVTSSIPVSVGNGTTVGGRYEFYKDGTPTKAGCIGNGISGGTASDNVIIGTYNTTTSWVSRVTIFNSPTSSYSARVSIGGTSDGFGLSVEGPNVADSAIQLNNTSATGHGWSIYSTGTGYSQPAGNLLFYRQGLDSSSGFGTFTWDGNFGLGTLNPLSKLSIGGDGYANRALTAIANGADFGMTLRQDSATGSGLQIFVNQNAWGGPSFNIANLLGNLLTVSAIGALTLSNLSGTGTRMVVADASGLLSTQAVPTGTVTGSGTTNYVSKWTSSSALGNSLIYDNGTFVGINTDTASTSLTGAVLTLRSSSTNVGQTAISIQGYDKKPRWAINGQDGTDVYNLSFYVGNGEGSYTKMMSLGSNQNVTIGNIVPGSVYKLEVDGSVKMNGALSTYSISINGPLVPTDRWFEVTGTTSGKVFGAVFNPTFTYTGANLYGIYVGNNFATGTITNSYNLYIEGTSIGSATITNKYGLYQAGGSDKNYFAGNVGINNTNPLSPLSFVNSTGNKIDFYNDGTNRYTAQINSGELRFYTSSSGDSISLYAGNVVGLFNKNGQVGIGTITPTATLTVAGSTDLAWSATTSKLQILRSGSLAKIQNYETGSAANIAIQWEGGNFGIGTIAPSYSLDVKSSARILNDSGANSITNFYVAADKQGSSAPDPYNIGGIRSQFLDSAWLSAKTILLGSALTGYGTPTERIAFLTDGTNLITSMSGYVGVGTNTPSNLIHAKSSLPRIIADTTSRYAVFNMYVSGTEKGAVYWDNTDDVLRVQANNVALCYAGTSTNYGLYLTSAARIGIGTIVPISKMEVRYNGNNGGGDYAGYNILATTDSTSESYQATIGAMHQGAGYANLNLGSKDVSGSNLFWHISKRLSADGHRLEYYYYNGSGFSSKFYFTTGGNFLAAGTATATAFYESSDSRLKTLLKDDYKALGIESVKARLYLKDGKEEIGYYAQDLESILPSAVSKNDAGFLSLSYTQVHTAKIAIIEDEVDVLKRRVSELESKLQKYEA